MVIEQIFGQQFPEPRPHHYVFAHQFLPDMFLHHQKLILPVFAGSDANEAIGMLWNKVGEQLPKNDVLDSKGLRCFPLELVGSDIAAGTIIFPPTERPPEAIYAAILFRPTTEQCRYVLLECSRKFLMICEHTSDGRHQNLGFGIKLAPRQEVSSEEFLSLVLNELPVESWVATK